MSDILNRANTYLASLGETSLHDGHPAVIVRELSEALASAREGNGTLTASLERCTDRIEALERERKSLNQSREEIEADYNEMHDRYYNTVDSLSASQAEASRLREALAQIDNLIGDSIRGNGEEDYTLGASGLGVEVRLEFAGYVLTTMQAIARAALSSGSKT